MHALRANFTRISLSTVFVLGVAAANAAEYRILATDYDVLAGETVTLAVEVETAPGDNLIGVGYFSFAIDLALAGTAGAVGSDIGNIAINESEWDDVASNQLGNPDADGWIGVGGVTMDATAPNFGAALGDVIPLFTFDLTVPVDALPGDTIAITPSEGFLQSLTVSDLFDPVDPQTFAAATLTVVPEPTTTLLIGLAGLVGILRRK